MTRTPPRLRGSNSSVSQTVETFARHAMLAWPLEKAVMVLACTPFLVGPPLLALGVVGREAFQRPRTFRFADWSLPVMIAVVNVILSVLVLQQLGGELLALIKQIGFWFQYLGPATEPASPIKNI